MKECPFCKMTDCTLEYKRTRGENKSIRHKAYVRCPFCHARGPMAEGKSEQAAKDQALKNWDRR